MNLHFYHNGSFTKEELKVLGKGEVLVSYGKRYSVCNKCLTVVKLNKPFLGSMHVCQSHEDTIRQDLKRQRCRKRQDGQHEWEYYEGTNIKNCIHCDIDVDEDNL